MLPLSRPTRDVFQDYEDAIATDTVADRAKALTGARSEVIASYSAYLAAMLAYGTCAALTTLPAGADSALRSTYRSMRTRSVLAQIRADLLGLSEDELDGYCPLCGVNQATTLDHFASQDTYPEFAIFGLNLVPCCARCNTLKGEKTGSTVEAIPFFHPYFHTMPAAPVLRARVVRRGGFIFTGFDLDPAACDPLTFARLTDHIRELDILRRVMRAGNGELVAFSSTCEGTFDVLGAAGVAAASAKLSTDLSMRWGVNHWRAVLHRALAADAAYCEGDFRLIQPRRRY